jgi:hypothetical protein
MLQVNQPVAAIRRNPRPDELAIFTVPEGSILDVVGGGQPDQTGLVDVKFKGEMVAIFQLDLEERTSLVLQ